MPLFDFECKICSNQFERLINNTELPSCPKCGGLVEKKISSTSNFIFKGGGYYCTDFKGKKNGST
jgi:putative FmdB family regulatory protein